MIALLQYVKHVRNSLKSASCIFVDDAPDYSHRYRFSCLGPPPYG